jgi:4-hydroxybenzoate polyprenyltransferase
MTRFWFKPKRYGYGARPVTWEGWLLALLPAAVAVVGSWWLTAHSRVDSIPLLGALLLVVLAMTAAVMLISRQKTDGPWRWRWGRWRT